MNIIPDNYGSETTWEFSGPGGAPIYAAGGPYTNGITDPINVNVCLDANTIVVFTIFDSYGDGICCGEGNGSYSELSTVALLHQEHRILHQNLH